MSVTPTIQATKDRRKSQRYLLTLPCHIVGSQQHQMRLTGRTLNLSSKGAFLVLHGAVEPDAAIEFMVTLQEELQQQPAIHLRCRGHVVRLEEGSLPDQLGVAATIDRYQFVRGALN